MTQEEQNPGQDQFIETTPTKSSDVTAPDIKKPRKKKKSKLVKVIIIVIVLAALGGGGWFLLKEPDFGEEVTETTGLTAPKVTESPTPTPQEVEEPVERDDISIEILNGTGIAKEASYLQGRLANLDYLKIETGNASEQDYEVATVTFSSSLDERIVDELTKEFEDIYNDVNTKTSSSLDVDVQVITGLRAGQTVPTSEPTSAPTPTSTASPSATPTL